MTITYQMMENFLELIEENLSDNNLSLRNLLGSNPDIWKKLDLQPDWVKKAIKLYGNYGEIFEKNLGSSSELKLQRGRSRLIKDGGMLKSQSFL